MSQRALALVALGSLALLTSGCGHGYRASIPLDDSVELVVRDERPDLSDDLSGGGWAFLPLVPLLPYWTVTYTHHLDRSFAPALSEHLLESNVFRTVYGPDEPHRYRSQAKWQLEVSLLELEDRRCSTTFLLGPAGAILWFFGLPQELVATDVALRVIWRSRERGAEPFETEGRAEVLRPYLVYVDSHGATAERVADAVGSALDVALRDGMRHLRSIGAR